MTIAVHQTTQAAWRAQRDIPVPAKARPGSHCADRGGWTGTHLARRAAVRNRVKIHDGLRPRKRPQVPRAAHQLHPFYATFPTGCLNLRLSLESPIPPKRRKDPHTLGSSHPPVWFHDGYRPCDLRCDLAPSRWVHSRVTLGVSHGNSFSSSFYSTVPVCGVVFHSSVCER